MCHLGIPFMNSELVFCRTERLCLCMTTLLNVYFIYSYMHMNENRGDIGCVPRGVVLESVSIAANSKPQSMVKDLWTLYWTELFHKYSIHMNICLLERQWPMIDIFAIVFFHQNSYVIHIDYTVHFWTWKLWFRYFLSNY